jgi:8-oxo-dGTP diphosphatase
MKRGPTIESTLAFVFAHDLNQVLLIEKQKPIQHKGMLNGLGGKLEKGETHIECVVREVEEEAGVHIPQSQWKAVGEMSWQTWQVSMWCTVLEKGQEKATFGENLQWCAVKSLPKNCLTNLQWLVPLCVDILTKIEQGEKVLPVVRATY